VSVLVVAANAVLAFLPGWLLLRALGWPRSQPERLLLAGPASIATLALTAALLGVGGRSLSLPALIALDVILGLLALRRGRLPWEERLPVLALLLGALPGLLLLGLVLQATSGLAPPPSEDSLVHAQVVRWFMDGHPAPPYIPDRLTGVLLPETRYGWHVLAATLARGSGLDPARAAALGVLPVVVLLPGCLMLLARRAGLGWRTVWLSGLVSVGVGIVPFRVLALGQAPLLAGGYVVAPAAALAVTDGLRLRHAGPCAAAVVLGGGLIYVHPSDLPTLLLLSALLVAIRRRDISRPLPREIAMLSGTAAALVAVALPWTRYRIQPLGPQLGTDVTSVVQSAQFFTARHLNGFARDVLGTLTTSVNDVALPVFAGIAVLVMWRRPAVRGFTALASGLLLLQVDAWGWQWPSRVLGKLFPWSSPERLLYLDWYAMAPLAAVGIAVVAGWLAGRLRRPTLAPVLAVVTAVLAVLPTTHLAPAMLAHAQAYQMSLTGADQQAMQGLGRVVPASTPILTDGDTDGGAWIEVFTNDEMLLHKDWTYNSAADQVRAALAGLCAPGEADRLRVLGVEWVYLGPKSAIGTGDADRSCLGGTPELQRVAIAGIASGGPWLFHREDAAAQQVSRG